MQHLTLGFIAFLFGTSLACSSGSPVASSIAGDGGASASGRGSSNGSASSGGGSSSNGSSGSSGSASTGVHLGGLGGGEPSAGASSGSRSPAAEPVATAPVATTPVPAATNGVSASAPSTSPAVTITDPLAGMSVATTSGNVPISFTTTNFELVVPGDSACPDASDNCGHIHLFVDGSACSPPDRAYDNDGQASPIDAILTTCMSVGGSHTVLLELHHNDHSPVLVSGAVVSTSVTFAAM